MEFTLEPGERKTKPWAAVVRLTPAMLACLEGQPGAASITLSATDNTLKIGDNSFNFTSIPEEVPGDLVRGSLEMSVSAGGGGESGGGSGGGGGRGAGSLGGGSLGGPSSSSPPPLSLEVAGSLQCRLQHKRVLSGSDGVAASVKRRVEQKVAEKGNRKAVMVDFIPTAAAAAPASPATSKKQQQQRKRKQPAGAAGALGAGGTGASLSSFLSRGRRNTRGAGAGAGTGTGTGTANVNAKVAGGNRSAAAAAAAEAVAFGGGKLSIDTHDAGGSVGGGGRWDSGGATTASNKAQRRGGHQTEGDADAAAATANAADANANAVAAARVVLSASASASASLPSPPSTPKISERLVALAAAAAKGASSRAANQTRAVILALLAERPLTFAALHAAVASGLAAANLTVPPRAAVEDSVKRVAAYRAPGRYYLSDGEKAEGDALLRAAEASKEVREASAAAAAAAAAAATSASAGVCVRGAGRGGEAGEAGGAAGGGGGLVLSSSSQGLKVLTPPLQVPANTSGAHARRAMMKSGLAADISGGLTDEDRDGGATPDYSAAPASPRAGAVRPRKQRQDSTAAGAEMGAETPGGKAAEKVTSAAATATATATGGLAAAAAAMFDGPVSERVAGDVDDSWMAFSTAAAAAAEDGASGAGRGRGRIQSGGAHGSVGQVSGARGGGGGSGGVGGGGGGSYKVGGGCPESELTCDDEYHRWSDEYNAHYGTYMSMYGALEANAAEFRSLMSRRDAAAKVAEVAVTAPLESAALSRRMAEFRVVRHKRYGAMARVFDWMEGELRAIKEKIDAYAAEADADDDEMTA